jgi:hypothetical protein
MTTVPQLSLLSLSLVAKMVRTDSPPKLAFDQDRVAASRLV